MATQVVLPDEIRSAGADEMQERIADAKRALGDRLVILGHHYQRDEVIRHADFTGDSFKLAQHAASKPEAEFIVFCGVHFMAESADILSADHQKVILPDLTAGCTMADMAETDQVEDCWDAVTAVVGDDIMPVTYMNSTAGLKAFVGRHGGAVCTSSNARAVLDWAFRQKARVLFFPDQHLGRNTGFRMGIPLEAMPVWDPYERDGGVTADALRAAKILLWKGHCSVHNRFTPDMVDKRREQMPGVQVIVHPECRFEVAQKADAIGSTEGIIKAVESSPAGTRWAVGTELNLVQRLAREQAPEREVVSLDDCFCVCSTMFRIDPPHLLWALENLAEGRVVNWVRVPPQTAADARAGLDRMLAIR
ncbi:MAG: quinolinate synthase NadA [Vicinamibacteria bacterium]